MSHLSLRKNAIFEMLRISALFSIMLISITTLTSAIFYKFSKSDEEKSIILGSLNKVNNFIHESNFPSLIKDIQQRTLLQEITITDPGCSVLATTSLNFKKSDCVKRSNNLILLEAFIGERKIHIYYKDDFSFIFTIKEYSLPLSVLALLFFVITYASLSFFLYRAFTSPLARIKKALIEDDSSIIPQELNFFGTKIIELKDEISSKARERAYFQLARRVVHDIRNPLAVLKHSALNSFSKDQTVINKIKEIEYQVDSLLGTKIKPKPIDLKDVLEELETDLQVFSSMSFSYQTNLTTEQLTINHFDLKNIFLNLARNSFEANATKLFISINSGFNELVLSVQDNGTGIPFEIVNSIFRENYSTKNDGFGIGLFSLKQLIEHSKGSIHFNPDFSNGAEFKIHLPIVNQESCNTVVLIDDDKYIHQSWLLYAKKNGKVLTSFNSVDDFIKNSSEIPCSARIYIDSSLGDSCTGEEQSERIFSMGFKDIHISTGFDTIDLGRYPWIKSITGKEPCF